jgi:hypothetical protein
VKLAGFTLASSEVMTLKLTGRSNRTGNDVGRSSLPLADRFIHPLVEPLVVLMQPLAGRLFVAWQINSVRTK